MGRRVRRRRISAELIMCGGGVRSILLLPLVARLRRPWPEPVHWVVVSLKCNC